MAKRIKKYILLTGNNQTKNERARKLLTPLIEKGIIRVEEERAQIEFFREIGILLPAIIKRPLIEESSYGLVSIRKWVTRKLKAERKKS